MNPIGAASFDTILNIGTSWGVPKNFNRTPIDGIGESPMFLSAIGSACAANATVSTLGVKYNGALNFIRQDVENKVIAFNLDKYLLSPMNFKGQRIIGVYLEPKQLTPDHIFTPQSNLFRVIDPWLKVYIQQNIGKSIK